MVEQAAVNVVWRGIRYYAFSIDALPIGSVSGHRFFASKHPSVRMIRGEGDETGGLTAAKTPLQARKVAISMS